jgi:hypothetical protein
VTPTTFTTFVPIGDRVRIVSGTLDGSTVRLEDGVLRDEPLFVATVAKLVATALTRWSRGSRPTSSGGRA